jgi:hypothetical protein
MMWKTLFNLTTLTSTLMICKNWTASLNMTVGKKKYAKAANTMLASENKELLKTP